MRVLVTGGSRGIGKAVADFFLEKSHEVFCPTREELDLNQETIHLKDTKFSVIINNAGINNLNPVVKTDGREEMRVNYFSPLQIVKQCLPYMIESRYGRIINVGSIWINGCKRNRLAYSSSKCALHSLTRHLAVEYGEYNILANTVSPGFIATELTYKNNSPNDLNNIINDVPLKRLGYPKEVAQLIYDLSIGNTFINGNNVFIDGGYSCI